MNTPETILFNIRKNIFDGKWYSRRQTWNQLEIFCIFNEESSVSSLQMQINFFKYFMWKGDFISKQLKHLKNVPTQMMRLSAISGRLRQCCLRQKREKGESWNMEQCTAVCFVLHQLSSKSYDLCSMKFCVIQHQRNVGPCYFMIFTWATRPLLCKSSFSKMRHSSSGYNLSIDAPCCLLSSSVCVSSPTSWSRCRL